MVVIVLYNFHKDAFQLYVSSLWVECYRVYLIFSCNVLFFVFTHTHTHTYIYIYIYYNIIQIH